MARVVYFTRPHKDHQLLGFHGPSNFVLNAYNADNQYIYRNDFKRPQVKANLFAMFNLGTSDGIKLFAWLEKENSQKVSSSNANFRVSLVAENSWAETQIGSGVGVAYNQGWTLDLTETLLTNQAIIGERTLKIAVDLYRFGKKYTTERYLNHLGIWDYALRTKKRVDFLEIEVL